MYFCSALKCELPLGDCLSVGLPVWIVGTSLGVIFIVTYWCDIGASNILRDAVKSAVVVTGSAMTTL